MSEELEQSSDAGSEVSSEPQTGSESSEGSQESASQSKESSENLPFHEHPRFKELINQKNEFADRLKQSEARFEQLTRELNSLKQPKAQEPTVDRAKLLERLKGIDPEFAAYQQSLLKELEELRGWRDMSTQERMRTEANAALGRLHQEYKIDNPELQSWYASQIRDKAQQIERGGRQLGVEDLPALYKSVHESINKFLDSRNKQAISEYVSQKKVDSNVPTNTRARAPKPNAPKPVQYSRDPEQARAQRAARILEQIRANNSES